MATVDAQRFNALIEPHLRALFRAAWRVARNRMDAEDLVQETCMRAMQRLGELQESRSVKAWLLTVMHNVFIDGARRAQHSPVSITTDGEPAEPVCPRASPEEQTSMLQRAERLHAAWSQLDRGYRIILALRAEEYSMAEIAQITGQPVDALYARLYRARLKLAQFLKDTSSSTFEERMEIAK